MPAVRQALGTRVARSCRMPLRDTRPAGVAPRASPFFCEHRLQRLVIERLLRDNLLEPRILVLELAQTLRVADLHAAELCTPAIERLLGHAHSPAHIADLRAGLDFLQRSDDLFFSAAARSTHRPPLHAIRRRTQPLG